MTVKIPVLIYLVIVAAFLNGCKKFDGAILVENSCSPLKVPCAGCKGSSTLRNTSTDKIITYTIKTTFIGTKKTFTTTKKIELYPGEEKDLGNNYDYGKQQQGSKCSETKSYEVRYEYEIVGQNCNKRIKVSVSGDLYLFDKYLLTISH